MSIEALLTSLKESIDRNTEALLKAGSSAGASDSVSDKPTKATPKEKPAKEDAPKVTQEEMNAALIKLKDDFGMPEAKKIIQEHGGCEKMAEIKPAKYKAVYDAAVKKHAELSEGGSAGDDDTM